MEKLSYQVSLDLRVNTIKEAISLIQTCYIVSMVFSYMSLWSDASLCMKANINHQGFWLAKVRFA